MAAAGVSDPRAVLKVGDTVVDIEEARAAGCLAAAVLSGTQVRRPARRAYARGRRTHST